MRNLVLGIVIGLALGALGALGYSRYLGADKQLSDCQSQLSAANASLAQSKGTLPGDAATSNFMAGAMKAGMAQHYREELLLLSSRLHLTPEQQQALKAAMDEEAANGEEMASKILAGGKIDPQAMNDLKGTKTVDQTLDDILTPDQKTAYQQIKTEEKNTAAETMATIEMSQFSPMLQLSDTQKDQAYSALADVESNMQDPGWIKNNVSNPNDPSAVLDAQAKAKEDALAKVLTPDQLATYHQQAQSQIELQKTMLQGVSPSGGAVSTQVMVVPAGP